MSRRVTRQFRGERLREARAESALTAESLAREIDVTLRTVQRWEAGDNEPKGSDVIRLGVRLARKPEWFYEEPDPMPEAA